MEKYSQYRDKGSGIAPFFPSAPTPIGLVLLPWSIFLVCLRVPLLISATIVWLLIVQWFPQGTLLRKANLWCIIGIPSIWWVDLQVDGVRRGSLGRLGAKHMPSAGSIIAASYTSPLDMIYLATIFDPVFAKSYPGTRLVRPISLLAAVLSCFSIAAKPKSDDDIEGLMSLAKLSALYPSSIIAVFPEGTTSNGRGILRFTHSLLSASTKTRIFPVSIRYTPQDVVTPMPGVIEGIRFLWRLTSQPTHTIRTRIGAAVQHVPAVKTTAMSHSLPKRGSKSNYEGNFFDSFDDSTPPPYDEDDVTEPERQVLDAVADTLARLGRVKRVSLGLDEKASFVQAWYKNSRHRK